MVNAFTATEIGDWFYAKLQEPYTGVTNVLDWDIVVGLSNANTVGLLQFTSGSTTINGINTNLNLVSGDTFIVGNITYTVDQVISATQFTITEPAPFTTNGIKFYLPPNANNQFTYEFSWSQSTQPDGGQVSELHELNKTTGAFDLLGLTFDSSLPLHINVKLTVDRLSQGSSLSLLSITYDLQTEDGQIISCPEFCTECTDPWSYDGCANILIDCTENNLFQPYQLKKPTNMYMQLTGLASDIYGHTVKYFRVEPDQRSRDVILMEYSLYNVVEQGDIKVIVPDNEFPTQELSFDVFGIQFEQFEVHLTKQEFNKAFGQGVNPRSRDYLYMPLNNRMYEVSSVSYADEFNMNTTYWRLMLKKYEDRSSSIHTDTAIEQEVDDLVVGIDEVFGEEIQQEFEKVTKPQQFKTTYQELNDGIRSAAAEGVIIKDADIRNRWTLISKHHYNLDEVANGEKYAITYNAQSKLTIDQNVAFTAWFRPTLGFGTNGYETLLEGRSQTDDSIGLSIDLGLSDSNVNINGTAYNFAHGSNLETDVWYGVVLNMNNVYDQVGFYLYKLDPNSNKTLPHQQANTMEPIAASYSTLSAKQSWDAEKGWSISKLNANVTNIRVFERVIEDEQHINVLQQYVVRDSDLCTVSDNAIPSIQLRRYSSPR